MLQRVFSKQGKLNFQDENGLFIHSQFDPEKEASRFWYSIKQETLNEEILIWGIGAAYLLESIFHDPNGIKKIFAIEPILEIYEDELVKKKFHP
ncbi:MAG: hypothetical protein SFU98_10230 [Leptospiraceae bacterium]|nr:hypothetical protein [Leptospiraceae bacterium]